MFIRLIWSLGSPGLFKKLSLHGVISLVFLLYLALLCGTLTILFIFLNLDKKLLF